MTKTKINRSPTLAKTLSPEDVSPGDFVAVLDVEYDFPLIVWAGDIQTVGADEVVRVRIRPCDSGTLFKVIEVCLPFVLTATPKGEYEWIDLRRFRIARLESDCAKRMWKCYQHKEQTKKSKKPKRRRKNK